MKQERWLRIIPVALIMYTISYVDRTNISLALEPKISSMWKDLLLDDQIKGNIGGIFFLGYVLLQIPGGYWANYWSAKKLVSIFLVMWGLCAVGCGLTRTHVQFGVMRFFLGVAESGVFPATTVLLANWFPRHERARANAYWNLCQPLAVMASAPVTAWLLGAFSWQTMLIVEGSLPFVWLPVWWIFISDHPREAKWISPEELEYLETTLKQEAVAQAPVKAGSVWASCLRWEVLVMVVIYFFQSCHTYGCMTFFTSTLKEKNFSAIQYGFLFATPYAVTAVIMMITSWSSDKMRERRGHVAVVYGLSGICLIVSVTLKNHFWISYGLMCLAIPGPYAGMAPFWAIPAETLPRYALGAVVGIVNAIGNVGGYVGQFITGQLSKMYGGVTVPFSVLGTGMILAALLAVFLLPKAKPQTAIKPS